MTSYGFTAVIHHLVFACTLGATVPAHASLNEKWVQHHVSPQGDASDRVGQIIRDQAGDVVVAGETWHSWPVVSQGVLIKYAADGAVQWSKLYGTANNGIRLRIAATASGDIVSLVSGRDGNKLQFFKLARHSGSTGALVWENEGAEVPEFAFFPTDQSVAPDGNVMVIGRSRTNDVTTSSLKKYSAENGSFLWEGSPTEAVVTGMQVDVSGDVVVTGSASGEIYTAKFKGTDGTIIWERNHGGEEYYDEALSISLDVAGNPAITGVIYSDFVNVIYTARLDGVTGEILWEKRHRNAQGGEARPASIWSDPDGNVVVTGSSGAALYSVAYDPAGDILWELVKEGGSQLFNGGVVVGPTADGNLLVLGRLNSDDYVAKIDGHQGRPIWELSGELGYPSGFVSMPDGNIAVAGWFANHWQAVRTDDIQTTKYSITNGAVLWQQNFNGEKPGTAQTTAIAFDMDGNVVVSGVSTFDGYVAKYRAGDGQLIWQRRIAGADALSDKISAMQLDSAGNVIVTGSIEVRTNGYRAFDILTAKFAAATGEILWERRYDGPDKASDEGIALAIGEDGDVFITGYSFGIVGLRDIYTAKYDGGLGSLLWERRHDGPIHLDDSGGVLWVDPKGDLILAGGIARNIPTYGQANYLAKYRGSDGSVLWELSDGAPARTLDSSGNILAANETYLAKYSSETGAVLWDKVLSPPQSLRNLVSLAISASDELYVAETWPRFNANRMVIWEVHLKKYDRAGDLLWDRIYAGPENALIAGGQLSLNSNGELLMYSTELQIPPGGRSAEAVRGLLTKFRSDGVVLWETRLDQPFIGVFTTDAGNIAFSGAHSNELVTKLYQDEPAAMLSASRLGLGQLLLSWPEMYVGSRIEKSADVANAGWSAINGSNTTNQLIVPIDGAERSLFFRLVPQ